MLKIHASVGELLLILVLGALQPITEILLGTQMATYYNVAAAALVCVYLIVRIARGGLPLLRKWGIRTDNFRACIVPHLLFGVLAGLGIYVYGWFVGTLPLPIGFWYLLALYPVWGFAQQFVLQNFLARNLEAIVPQTLPRSILVGFLFMCAHFPSVPLMVLTLGGGICFTLLYYRYPNLYALGIAHGIIGALAFHLVLGQNQWEILMRYFS